jgi:hypothetical protein
MNTTTERYTIISDVEIKSHDTSVRLYWTGSGWNNEPDMCEDYDELYKAAEETKVILNQYPFAKMQILRIKSTTEDEYIEA